MGYDLAACDYASLWNENLIKIRIVQNLFLKYNILEECRTGSFGQMMDSHPGVQHLWGLVTLDLLMALMGGINLLMNSLNRMKVINVKILPYFMKDVRILMESPI